VRRHQSDQPVENDKVASVGLQELAQTPVADSSRKVGRAVLSPELRMQEGVRSPQKNNDGADGSDHDQDDPVVERLLSTAGATLAG
jgi:hypothetical protein